ncbi:MAG: LysR substrate-binding domain-containing protein [Pseudomonadota bacterium]
MSDTTDSDLRAAFLGGMSHAACTVNVVTTDGPAGRAGVTVSAMTSVSADTPKPTLLVCVHHQSPAARLILENGVFCVNVLRDDQSYIADTFAGRFKAQIAEKFDCAKWTMQVTGAPRVVDPLVAFDCRVISGERIGTHHVVIGEVLDIVTAARGSALIYANRAYGRAAHIEPVSSIAAGALKEGEELRIGCFHTFGPYLLPAMVAEMNAEQEIGLKLIEGDHRRVLESLRSGETDIALIYDFDLGDDLETEPLSELEPYVLISAAHPLAEQAAISLRDLVDQPMVLLDAPPSADYFLSIFTDGGFEPKVRYRTASFEMVRGFVGHGLGFALLATKPASSVTYDGQALAIRPLREDVKRSRVVIARRRGAPISKAIEAFARHCRTVFKPT